MMLRGVNAVAMALLAGAAAAAEYKAPKTVYGQPDLQGVWNTHFVLPIEAAPDMPSLTLPEAEAKEYLSHHGVSDSGVSNLIRAAYHLLGLRTYLTAGEKEARAWTIHAGDTAPQAAGVIHSDFERGFIKAETVFYDDLLAAGSMVAAKEKGLVRQEGKEYVVQDGDVILFKFNV